MRAYLHIYNTKKCEIGVITCILLKDQGNVKKKAMR